MRPRLGRKVRMTLAACVVLAAGYTAAEPLAHATRAAAGGDGGAVGGGTGESVSLSESTSLMLAVSPDAKTIAMGMLDNLWTLPVSGGTAKRISSYTLGVEYPSWSPDGGAIAFNSYKDGTYHIWSMSPDGSNVRRLTNGFYDDREPQFSPDGTKIAFSSDRPPAGSRPGAIGGSYNVWVLTLASGALTQVTHAGPTQSDYYPTWSSDGTRIGYVNTSHEIDSIAADGSGAPTTLYSDPNATLYSPTWSPDGSHLAYVESVSGPATRLMVDGKAVSDEGEDVFTFPARWTSSSTLIYGADGHIQQRDLSTGRRTTIPFTATVSFNRPEYRMKRQDFDSARPRSVKGIVAPALSPDGRRVAFVALNQVYVMRIGGRPHAITDDPYFKASPTWSPDGRYLAYSSDRAGAEAIYIRAMRTGDTRRLTKPFDGSQVETAWSPDGRKIAFQTDLDTETDVNTYVADVASGRFRQVLPTQFEPGRPSWGPHSDVLALAEYRAYSNRGGGLYGAGSNKIFTVNVNTGDTQWYDPFPNDGLSIRNLDDGPVWSPDGRYMAYVLQDVLWVLPVTPQGAPAGRPRQVTQEVADQISWSGDSRQLLYDSDGRLRLVSVDGGRPRTVPVRLRWRQAQPAAGATTVIHAGAVWTGTSGSLRRNVDILVQGNRIASVGAARPRSAYGGDVSYVEASGLTVMPGMWDAHVHEELDQPYAGGRKDRLMLALGVTSMMSMGDPAYSALEQVESQKSGARVGPRYFWSAEPVDGRRVYWNWMRSTPNRTALARELDRIVALDPDALKTYVRLPTDYEATAIAVGHQLGIPSYSHFFWPALQVGQDGTSHQVPERRGYKLAYDANSITYDDVNTLYARSGMSNTDNPFGVGAADYFPQLPNDQRLKALLTPWQYADAVRLYAAGPMSPAALQGQRNRSRSFAAIMEKGGHILTGTDAPLGVGDFGAVVNMATMVNTGMTNYQTLRSATIEPAIDMGVEDDLGTIEPGKLADLDIIRGNPLADIDAIANEVYVMQNGHLYSEHDLLGPYGGLNLNPSQTAPMTGELNGANEPGGGDPSATGYAVVTVNRITGRLCYTVTSDIAGATAMHIHAGGAGVNGPVVVPLDPAAINHGTRCLTVSPTLANQLLSKPALGSPAQYYLNIHTAAHPDGAIRGQLTESPPNPDPPTSPTAP